MHIHKKIVSFSVVIILIVVLVVGIVTVLPTTLPATAQSSNILSFQSGPFVGSKNSNVYHYPSCYEAKKIKPENLVTFATACDAYAAGYRPCLVCKPPQCPSTPTLTPTVKVTPMPTVKVTPMPTVKVTPTPTAKAKTLSATPTPSVSPAASNIAQASAPASSSSTPGFEALYAVAALAAMFLVLRFRRRN